MSADAPRLSAKAWGLILALSLPWGGSFVFYRLLAGELPSLTIVLGRVGIAALALWLLVRLRGGRLRLPWRGFAVLGLLNNVIPFTLIAWAETRITGGTAAILNATTPICAALVLRVLAGERLTAGRLVGILLGLAGVAVLVGPSVAELAADLWAELACVAAAFSYGLTAWWSRRLPKVDPLHAAAGQCLCSTLILLPLVALIDRPWTLPPPSPATWGALAGIALVSTALAYVIFFRIVALAGPANVMLVTLVVPVSALLLGWAFLSEAISPAATLGMLLIAAGLAAIDGRALRWAIRAPPSP